MSSWPLRKCNHESMCQSFCVYNTYKITMHITKSGPDFYTKPANPPFNRRVRECFVLSESAKNKYLGGGPTGCRYVSLLRLWESKAFSVWCEGDLKTRIYWTCLGRSRNVKFCIVVPAYRCPDILYFWVMFHERKWCLSDVSHVKRAHRRFLILNVTCAQAFLGIFE